MRKVLTVALLIVLVLTLASTIVKATTQSELEAYLTKTHTIAGKEVSLTDADKVKVERYLSENTLTEEQVAAIKAKVDEGIAIMEKAGVSDYTKLKKEDKTTLLNIAKEAATIAGLTLTINSKDGTIEIYKGTTLIEATSFQRNKLVQTGENNFVWIGLAGIAIIAIATTIIVKKVRTNA